MSSPNSMKTYRITATGRESGAIGIVYPFTDIVEAESDSNEDILLPLYEGKTASGKAWEHITPRRIEIISPVIGQRKENQ